jgi:hypothetical protein
MAENVRCVVHLVESSTNIAGLQRLPWWTISQPSLSSCSSSFMRASSCSLSPRSLSLPSLSDRPLRAPLLAPPTDAATSPAAREVVRMPPPMASVCCLPSQRPLRASLLLWLRPPAVLSGSADGPSALPPPYPQI